MTATYRPADPIWCAGCGHFGVQASLMRALDTLGIAPHDALVLAGIGCSGTIQNTTGAYGYHALHGRVLPTSLGAHLANPALTVVAAGGDGDGYAIGMGHLVHTFRRNPSFAYLLMNNAVYGLTKGQPSPTSENGGIAGPRLDPITLGLSLPTTTFVARGFARHSEQLDRLMELALRHARERRGFAFLEILSPCVNYNDTYPVWESAILDLDADPAYQHGDRLAALQAAATADAAGRLVTGLIYQAPPDASSADANVASPVDGAVAGSGAVSGYRDMLARFRV